MYCEPTEGGANSESTDHPSEVSVKKARSGSRWDGSLASKSILGLQRPGSREFDRGCHRGSV